MWTPLIPSSRPSSASSKTSLARKRRLSASRFRVSLPLQQPVKALRVLSVAHRRPGSRRRFRQGSPGTQRLRLLRPGRVPYSRGLQGVNIRLIASERYCQGALEAGQCLSFPSMRVCPCRVVERVDLDHMRSQWLPRKIFQRTGSG